MNRIRIRAFFATAAALALVVDSRLAADPPVKKVDTRSNDGQVEASSVARQIFPLKFAIAKDLATAITQLFATTSAQPAKTSEAQQDSSSVVAVADDRTNSLTVTTTEETLRKVREIVAKFDIRISGQTEMRVFRLRHREAGEVAETIDRLYADSSTRGKAVAADAPRTNSLLVAAARETLAEIAEMVGRLDSLDARHQRVFVRSLTHADPDSVAYVLRRMLDGDALRPEEQPPVHWNGDILTPLEKSRFVIPPSDRVRK